MKTEVLIIGGGVPGLSLALLLGRAGANVCVVDTEKVIQLKDIEQTGRTVALWDGSIQLLKDAGLWTFIADYSQPIETLRIIDDSSKRMEPVTIDFEARDIGLDVFGYNVPVARLRAALVEAIGNLNTVTHIAPARLQDYQVESGQVLATLEDGQTIKARLIVGADGRRSATRSIAHIDVSEQDYGQSAITCLINHTKSHQSVSTEHHRPGGPFTTVPMPDLDGQHQSAVVWMEKHETAEQFMRFDKQHLEQALQERTRSALGKVSLATNPQVWPIITQHAHSLIAPRCALMAEAAHVMSPIGAQGLNLSLRDVASLSGVLLDAMQVGEDPGSHKILKAYDRQRRGDIQSRVYGIDLLNRFVSNEKVSLRALRRMGLKTLDGFPMLKEIAMNYALKPGSLHHARER